MQTGRVASRQPTRLTGRSMYSATLNKPSAVMRTDLNHTGTFYLTIMAM